MATSASVFINAGEHALVGFARDLIDHCRRHIDCARVLRYRDGNQWLTLTVADLEHAAELAHQLNLETISLAAQSLVDYYQYKHFAGSKLLRELEYCLESDGWLTVAGEPEPWEREGLFSRLSDDREFLQQSLDETTDPKRRAAIETEIAALENHRVVAGHTWPSFCATTVGKAYGLPGFGPEMLNPMGMRNWWSFEESV